MKKIYLTTALLCCVSSVVFAQNWSLTGNAGTNAATNFIGTTDNKPLVIRVNNSEIMRVKAGGRIDITNSTQTVYLGKNAGIANQAAANVFIGYQAANKNDFGDYNVALGYNAMYNCTSFGDHNVAVGANALFSAVNGQSVWNTAIGADVLSSNSYGVSNTSTGYYSMHANTSGSFNTANGEWALLSNISGGSNTAIGEYAAGGNTTGSSNTALGARALLGNKTGNTNIAIGIYALTSSLANSGNIAIGDSALGKYNDGTFTDYMVALGSKAGSKITTGYFNTCLGSSTLQTLTTGNSNTAIGYGANVAASNLSNTTALGRGAVATASNQVMLGNSAVTVVRTFGTVIVPSDGRFKKNIKKNVPGLDFINALQPVTYNFDMHKLDKHTGADKMDKDEREINTNEKARTEKEKKLYTGFIAQEVEKIAEKLGYDFSGVYKPQTDADIYGLSYSDFVMPLVKAIQELSAMNNKKDSAITALAQQNAALEARLAKIENMLSTSSVNTSSMGAGINATLQQNVPNPVQTSTVISYTLPAKHVNAFINVTDKHGNMIKQVNISGSGKGQIRFDASSLNAGTYQYSLLADGKTIASKQMVIAK